MLQLSVHGALSLYSCAPHDGVNACHRRGTQVGKMVCKERQSSPYLNGDYVLWVFGKMPNSQKAS